jgi:hypothetical protein
MEHTTVHVSQRVGVKYEREGLRALVDGVKFVGF